MTSGSGTFSNVRRRFYLLRCRAGLGAVAQASGSFLSHDTGDACLG